MKKIQVFWLLLAMLIGTGLNAAAYQMTFEWDTPGSVEIHLGSLSGPSVELTSDQTSYTYEFPEGKSFDHVYIFSKEGYVLSPLTMPNGATLTPSFIGSSQYISLNLNSANRTAWGDGKTVHVTSEILERKQTFTLDVVNGADFFTATFAGLGYQPEFVKGSNTVHYNPSYDQSPLTIKAANGQKKLYSVKLNDTEIADKWANYPTIDGVYEVKDLNPGDVVTVRVFEGDDVALEECTVTVSLPDNLKDCINSIRNRTANVFVTLDDNNSFSVVKGAEVYFNFKEDYNFTSFFYGTTDLTDSYNAYNRQLPVTISESGTLRVEGSPVVYADVEFKAYLMNPEGVELTLGTYSGAKADLSGGEALASDLTIGGITFTPANTRLYTIKVSSKSPNVYIKAAESGKYYIAKVLGTDKKDFENTYADYATNPTFYVVAKPLENDAKMTIVKNGNGALRLNGNTSISQQWSNPEHSFSVTSGEQTVDFCYGYDAPFSIRDLSGTKTFQVYQDGAAVAINEEYQTFAINPANTAVAPLTTVNIYSGSAAATTRVSYSLEYGTSAEFFYSPLRHSFTGKNMTLLRDTEIAVKPGANSVVKVGEETIAPGADGFCVFKAAGSTQKISVVYEEPDNTVEISIDPAAGTTMKSISIVDLYVPVYANYEHTPAFDTSKSITLTKEGGEPVAGEVTDCTMNSDETAYKISFTFGRITEAGKYTLDVPEGFIYESAWDDAAGATVKPAGAAVNAAVSAVYTVDPAFMAPTEKYTLTPADGAGVKTLGEVIVAFPEIAPNALQRNYNVWTEPVISNGTTDYECFGQPYEHSEECGAFRFTFMDADYEDMTITEKGKWTISIPAGYFKYGNELTPAIEATFNVGETFTLSPADGSTTSVLTGFKLTFSGASTVEYNDTPITLEGEGFSASTTGVSGTGTFTINFNKTPYTAGEYTLTIPAGAFTVDGEPSDAIKAVYTFKPAWILTPAPGSTVESLDVVTIEFPEAKDVEFNNGLSTLTNNSSYASPSYECNRVEGASHPTFTLTMPAGAQKAPMGTLSFIIEEGAFTIDGESSPEVIVPYTIEHEISKDYIIEPSSTILIGSYGINWAFIFDETVRVSIADASKVEVSINGNAVGASDFEIMPEGNMLMMGIYDKSILEAGTLHVTAEAGAFTLNGEPAPALEGTWQLVEPKNYTFELTPDPEALKVNDLSSITIVFPEASSIKLYNQYGISLTQGYTYRATVESVEVSDAEARATGASATIKFANAPTEAGAYSFVVRQGTFTLDGAQESPEISVTYGNFTTGIEVIEINGSTEVTVVSLNGQVLLKNAPAAELGKLPAGVYIVNGVKMLLNK